MQSYRLLDIRESSTKARKSRSPVLKGWLPMAHKLGAAAGLPDCLGGIMCDKRRESHGALLNGPVRRRKSFLSILGERC